ncbi:MAG TPA: hypothetical protein VFP01_04625 [Propionibacteriaceae bacterium]|nr:hypothetical protein [Propionibacteriaceae bacterium]
MAVEKILLPLDADGGSAHTDAGVRDAERRAGAALQTMTSDEGLPLRESTEGQSTRDSL